MTSLNYDGKNVRDARLFLQMSSESIFHESMRQGINWVLLFFGDIVAVFLRGDTLVFLGMKKMESVLALQH